MVQGPGLVKANQLPAVHMNNPCWREGMKLPGSEPEIDVGGKGGSFLMVYKVHAEEN